jgi:hypothetical protein
MINRTHKNYSMVGNNGKSAWLRQEREITLGWHNTKETEAKNKLLNPRHSMQNLSLENVVKFLFFYEALQSRSKKCKFSFSPKKFVFTLQRCHATLGKDIQLSRKWTRGKGKLLTFLFSLPHSLGDETLMDFPHFVWKKDSETIFREYLIRGSLIEGKFWGKCITQH